MQIAKNQSPVLIQYIPDCLGTPGSHIKLTSLHSVTSARTLSQIRARLDLNSTEPNDCMAERESEYIAMDHPFSVFNSGLSHVIRKTDVYCRKYIEKDQTGSSLVPTYPYSLI